MFFQTASVPAEILTVIRMGWEQVNARAGYRPFHALALRVMGGATIFAEGQAPEYVDEGEITFTPAGLDFSKQADRGEILVIHFTSPAELPAGLRHFKPKNFAFFQTAFEELLRVWTRKELGYEHESRMLFYRILLAVEREWSEQRPSVRNELLATACHYIHKHFTDSSLTVAELARMSGMSDTYFRRLFEAEFGMPPLRYINRLRLTMALELLRSDYYSVQEIAARCGFQTVSYFSFFIKRETGLSPLQYKKTCGEMAVRELP